jgi:acyl-CoA reductase-like NAD-dependent aldehyde dehydrogenase
LRLQRLPTHLDELARLFTLEQGRSIEKAKEEILGAAFWCQNVSQQEIPISVNEDSAERRSETRHVPIGVVGGIVPWNYPILLRVWKIAPALLTGNTLVIKPSPFTPLTMLRLAELMGEHLRAGVFNAVSGGDQQSMHLMPWIPFGGHKQSGLGVENGVPGLLEYTNPQTITVHKT